MQGKNSSRPQAVVATAMTKMVGRSAEEGALPILCAATAKEAPPATMIGPGRAAVPRVEKLKPLVTEEDARALWEFSENATGVRYG